MVEAGWSFDPSPDTEDGVTCFYCNLSLDGWEPKDDPLEEHRRRSPECPFFALIDRFDSVATTKGKGNAKARASRASKGSRLSAQSQMSTFSEAPSLADLGDDAPAVADDSVLTTATNASTATVKGKKKPARPKAAAKGAKKGKKAASRAPSEEPQEIKYPSFDDQIPVFLREPEAVDSSKVMAYGEPAPAPAPARPTRKGRSSKQVDSSVLVVDSSVVEPPVNKSTRGRKAETQVEPEIELDDVSAQLQHELDESMDLPVEDEQRTPQETKPKRGVKRTSDGLRKVDESVVSVEVPVKAMAKGKKGKKPAMKKAVEETEEQLADEPQPPVSRPHPDELPVEEDIPQVWIDSEPAKAVKAAKAKRAPTKKAKGKKNSTLRSSQLTVPEPELEPADEDLEKDEMEIEAEMQRMAAEEAAALNPVVPEVPAEEFEPSPTPRHADKIHQLEEEMAKEMEGLTAPGQNLANYVTTVATSPPQAIAPTPEQKHLEPVPSPTPSDKENAPPSSHPPSTKQRPQTLLSPTKTIRIPLAPGTPNRSPRKPLLSPSKQISHLTSVVPWEPADLDTLLLVSPQASPNKLGARLVEAAGGLTSPEKGMTVEQWVRWRAEMGEAELRRRCEEVVGVFEREGVRAGEVLAGIEVL